MILQCDTATYGVAMSALFPSSAITGDPNVVSSLCGGDIPAGTTCVTILNTTDEIVSVISAGRTDPVFIDPYQVATGTFFTQSTITVKGETTGTVYVNGREIVGKEQTVYVEPPLPAVVQVKTGSFAFLALTLVAALVAVALGVTIGITNSRVNRLCPAPAKVSGIGNGVPTTASVKAADVDIDKLLASLETPQVAVDVTPGAAVQVNSGLCTAEKRSGMMLSWWLLLIPLLVFIGALVGYILIERNVLGRASIRSCAARGGSWQPGYTQNSGSTDRNLCRMFGVCDCLNSDAQRACNRFGFMLANGQLGKRKYIPAPSGLVSYEHDERIKAAIAQASSSRNVQADLAGKAPYYSWNQSIANRADDFDKACCPTADAPPGSECYNCSSGTCMQ